MGPHRINNCLKRLRREIICKLEEWTGGIYDVSNKRRLGITEWDGVKDLIKGCQELIESETKLQQENKENPDGDNEADADANEEAKEDNEAADAAEKADL